MKLTSTFILLLCTVPSFAFALDPHVEAVIQTVQTAKGKVEKTEDGQSLKLVDLAVPNTGPHDHRKDDPYDAAFFEHLGHITTLESLNIIATKANDEWIMPLGRLTNLKTLRFTNNGKLTDAGMETFARLTNLESFSFVGTQITGRAYAQCTGWTQVNRVSHRGSKIDDAGLQALCEHLPNLESLSLAHAHFTNVGAVHLAKLTKLKSLELGSLHATPAALKHLRYLPLTSLQLGEGFHSAEAFTSIKSIPTLRSLSITDGSKLTDIDLRLVASITQLDSLILDRLQLTNDRISILSAFSHLKTLSLALRPKGYPEEMQVKVKALLPKVDVKFVK